MHYFLIFILDLMENCLFHRCVMALICGSGGNFPCPICLVPNEEQNDLEKTYPLRTTKTMKHIVEQALRSSTKAAGDHLLKDVGLRGVMVCCT